MGVKHGLSKYRRNADSEQHLDITTMKHHYEGKPYTLRNFMIHMLRQIIFKIMKLRTMRWPAM